MGISRIDQPEKHNHGYYVRVYFDGKILAKYFADKANGGKRAALKAAKACEVQLMEQAASRRKRKKERPTSRNTSGKVGVSRTSYKNGGGESAYWQAAWTSKDGQRKGAKFSVSKYGEEKARRLAIKARREGMLTSGGSR